MRAAALLALLLAARPVHAADGLCTYDTYKWNVNGKTAVAREQVEKPYATLTPQEIDAATGCSVCREDQAIIALPGLAPFQLCRHVAGRVEQTLNALLDSGVAIRSVVGYRVGMTRGEVDAQGNRTRFSNHSFGVALDINEAHNGLYESCIAIGPQCRLRKGGRWTPGSDPLSMTAEHPVVAAMKAAGFRWGGELAGRQKDFMHFSLSGD